MTVPLAHLLRTEAEYLALEREAAERHEYLDGYIYAMAGESLAHGDICTNLTVLLGSQLKGRNCRALSKDTKVRSGPRPFAARNTKGLYSYPDILVVCGRPKVLDKYEDVITNPRVIIEVISESTASFDRTDKFIRYQLWNESLTDYLLIAQDQPFVEHFERRKKGAWLYHAYQGLDQIISIRSIKCSLTMADVYDRIRFASTKKAGRKPAKKSAGKARSSRKSQKGKVR